MLTTSQNPFIHKIRSICLFTIFELILSLIFISLNILYQKSISIVPGQKNILYNRLNPLFFKIECLRSNQRTIRQIHPNRIRPVFINNFVRIRIILQPFRHFFPICCQNKSIYNQIFIRIFIENCG